MGNANIKVKKLRRFFPALDISESSSANKKCALTAALESTREEEFHSKTGVAISSDQMESVPEKE
jgi:hypothetical protein